MKRNKKILSLVMVLTMILSMTTGIQTAWADGGGTITSASELYAGELGYDKAVITLENDTFSPVITSTGLGVEIDGAVTSYDIYRDSDTQLRILNIRKDGQALDEGDTVKIFVGTDNLQTSTTTNTFTMEVKATRPVALDTANPPNAKLGENYSYTFTAIGGVGARTFVVGAGALPNGLTLNNNTGVLCGTATTEGNYSFTITATDSDVMTSSCTYSMAVGDAPTITTNSVLYAGEIGYNEVLINLENATFKEGISPFVSYIKVDNINDGSTNYQKRLSDTQFLISDFNVGRALMAGDQVIISFSSDCLTEGTLNNNLITLTVQPTRPVTLDTTALDSPVVGEYYSHTFSSIGGVGYKTFEVTSGTLPDGVQIYSSGQIVGTPTTAGQYTFTVKATDKSTPAVTGSCEYTLVVKDKITSGDYKYANGVIYGYVGSGGDIVIPSELGGTAITAIGKSAFSNNTNIKSVKIPNSIKTIESHAFNGCRNLKSIVIPDSVTSIKSYAFGQSNGGSYLLKAIFLGDAPETDTVSFYNTAQGFKVYYLSSKSGYSADWKGYTCEPFDLTSTYNITYNGNGNDGGTVPTDNAVYHTADTFATLSSGDLSKTGYSFKCWNTKADGAGTDYNSGDLFTVGTENITLYAQWNKVYTITKGSAMKNGSLSIWLEGKEVSATKAHQYVTIKLEPATGYRYAEGTLRYQIEGEEGYYYISNMPGPMTFKAKADDDDNNSIGFMMTDKNIVITADFELTTNDYSVYEEGGGYGGISKYYGLGGNLIIPSKINDKNIIGIATDAFSPNSGLTGVTFPDGLIYVGNAAFAGCDSLSAVVLPDSLEQIGNYCFADCAMLRSIIIPSKVKTIGYEVFSGSDMLTSVCFEGDAVPYDWEYAFDGTNSDLVI